MLDRWFVGYVSEWEEGNRKIVNVNDLEICIFYHKNCFHAYANDCPHKGGPVCEGVVLGKVEAVLADDRTFLGERFSVKKIHFICPWHGYEFDVETGECAADRSIKVTKFEIELRGAELYVVV